MVNLIATVSSLQFNDSFKIIQVQCTCYKSWLNSLLILVCTEEFILYTFNALSDDKWYYSIPLILTSVCT